MQTDVTILFSIVSSFFSWIIFVNELRNMYASIDKVL